MKILIIMFMVVSALLALFTLGYISGDIVMDMILKKKDKTKEDKQEEPVVEEPVVEEPVVEEVVPEIMPEFVEEIDAEEADNMISDELAIKGANYESGAGSGQQGIINIGMLNDRFEANDVITLAVLKERGLISKKAGRMKVLADGVLNKPLIIKSESYSIQAIMMIELTGGTVIILRN